MEGTPPKTERNKTLLDFVGIPRKRTFTEAAKQFGISKQRVAEIYYRDSGIPIKHKKKRRKKPV